MIIGKYLLEILGGLVVLSIISTMVLYHFGRLTKDVRKK